jgi:serine/threonine-protein kinase
VTDDARDLRGRTVEGFRVESLLGRGGMGEVWKAWDTRLDRQVALKVLSPNESRDRENAVRFEREEKAVSGVSHPNIAHVYATGRFEGRPFYVMEFIEGRSLGKILAEEGRIPGRRCLDFLRQAAEGLAEARARGVIHRDVKPDNLMVDYEDRLKIVDFGLARRIEGNDDSLTQTNMVVGTPKYMAPEQATGGAVDHRSDIYALGATFYHLFSGQAPFDAPTPVAVMMKHVHEPLVPLRERVPQVPVGVSAIVDRMMAKLPEQRYQSYEELIADVKRALAGSAPRVAASTVSLPPAKRAPETAPGRSAPPWPALAAGAGAIAVAVFLAFRAGHDTKELLAPTAPAPALERSAPRPAAPPSADPSGEETPGRGPATLGERPARPAPGGALSLVGAMGISSKTKTLMHLRRVATALAVWLNAGEDKGLPGSLEELTRDDRWAIHPAELKDGWGRALQYDRLTPYQFRLSSAGQDGSFGSDDDIVMEDGVIVKGDLDERAFERFRPPNVPR